MRFSPPAAAAQVLLRRAEKMNATPPPEIEFSKFSAYMYILGSGSASCLWYHGSLVADRSLRSAMGIPYVAGRSEWVF